MHQNIWRDLRRSTRRIHFSKSEALAREIRPEHLCGCSTHQLYTERATGPDQKGQSVNVYSCRLNHS